MLLWISGYYTNGGAGLSIIRNGGWININLTNSNLCDNSTTAVIEHNGQAWVNFSDYDIAAFDGVCTTNCQFEGLNAIKQLAAVNQVLEIYPNPC